MALPCELIYDEILCRLPVKYLLRYRCVSKKWCSVIDSNAFVKKHLKKAIESNPDGDAVIFTGANKCYYLADLESLYADEDIVVTEFNDALKIVLYGARFVGTANCLACFSKDDINESIILNPSTRKYKKVPSMPREFASWFGTKQISHCGFGYDHVNEDYKFVKIMDFCGYGMMFMVYSLKSNCWTWVDKIPTRIRLVSITGMFTCGSLYWLATSIEFNHEMMILGFDLGLEQFKEVPFPTVYGNSFLRDGGPLCVFDKYISSHMDVWLIKNYGAEDPWCKAFSVEQSGALGSFDFIRPVAFSKNGRDALLDVDSTKLVWYDPKGKSVKNVRIHGIPSKFGAHLYRESLFELTETEQLQKPSSSEDKKKKKQRKKRNGFLLKRFKLKLLAYLDGKIDELECWISRNDGRQVEF